MPVTVRATTKVRWKPAYTITLSSTDGLALPSDGSGHELVAILTRTSNGDPIVGRLLRLTTDPVARVGENVIRYTDGEGKARYTVSDTLDETVTYQSLLAPLDDVESNTVAIVYGTSPPPPVDWTMSAFTVSAGPYTPDGTLYSIYFLVTESISGDPVVGAEVFMTTDPAGRPTDGTSVFTDGDGKAFFDVSNFFVETVTYTGNTVSPPSTATNGLDYEFG